MAQRHRPAGPRNDPERARPLYRKLKPGPGISPEKVASHQRARIHGAMVEIAAERGYDAVTVGELTALAGVSTHTFYERFSGKEDCFLCTYDEVVRKGARKIVAAQSGRRDWRDRLRLAFRTFTEDIERERAAARLALVEVFAAGPSALRRVRWAESVFEAMIARGPSNGANVSPLTIKGILAGAMGVVRARLVEGREDELPGLADELANWALYFCDEEAVTLERCCRSAPTAPELEESSRAAGMDALLGDERSAILLAAARLSAAEGYDELTVPRIRAAAGVSRKSFDEHFDGVTDCFLESLESHLRHAMTIAVAEARRADRWAVGVQRAMTSLCTTFARDPVLAKLALTEIYVAGPEGARCRARLAADVAAAYRESAPREIRPSELTAEASMAAAWGVLRHHVVDGGNDPRQLAGVLSFFALVPAIGAAAAAKEMCQKRPRHTENAKPRIQARA